MPKIYNLLHAYMLRLPFFLLVYSIILIINGEAYENFLVIALFMLLCAFDVLTDRFRAFMVIASFVLAAIFIFLGMYASAITILIFTAYKTEQYRTISSIVLIACLFLVTAIATLFINPALGVICARNLIIATVAKILARQIQTLDRFLNSYHCRGVSRKTASSLIKRSYLLTITSLACFIAVGFIARPGGTTIPIPDFTIQRFEDAHENVDSATLMEDEDVEILIEETEETQTILQPEPEADHREPNILYAIIFAVFAIFAIYIVMFYIKYYRPETQFEDYDDVVEEAPAILEKMSKRREKFFNFGINHTIRRLFKRKVKEYIATKGMSAQKSDTPKKLAETISEWEDIGALEQLYHKARYSGENVKRIELNMLKK